MKHELPYALVYKNKDIYNVYTTFDGTQIIFYWDKKSQEQYRHPVIRDTKEILPDCYIKMLSRFGCQLIMWGHLVEFKFDHSKSLKDSAIVWHGPIIDTKGEWEDDPDFARNSPTSSGTHYDGVYNNHYSCPQEHEE
jgi:hypothetical protein